MDARDVIIRPLITEKSTMMIEEGKYTFVVDKKAAKDEIKAAVETIFEVKVESVRTLNFQGKVRRTARGFGKRSDWKKAYVTLPEGTQFDVEEAAQVNKESK